MDSGTSETRPGSSSSYPVDPGGFAPGTILADRYRIVALVGRGGMGQVYRADDLRLGQPVALKFLPASLEGDAAARERLLAEVRNARTVSHPNVCRVYDVGELPGPGLNERSESKGRVFLTMEYIDGEDLGSLLRRIGRLPAAKALEIARELCAGLGAAHDKGVLHRDLKPANVMIDGRGQARITDFGLAVEATPADVAKDFAGTVAYMAPERFQGKPATVRSDLYALGLILYETFTGKPAFKASSVPEWQRVHTDSTPASPAALVSEIEAPVDRAILRCLEKDPARRPASAAQVAAALPGGDPLAAAIAAGETPSPELVAASGEEGTLPRAQAWLWLAACLIGLAVLPLTLMPFNLTEHVQFDLSPDALQARAREVIRDLGYPDAPRHDAWWMGTDADDLRRLDSMLPGDALADIGRAAPGPFRFCYRQSPAPLVPWGANSHVSAIDPPPESGDLYVELDLAGRLVALRVVPPRSGDARPSNTVTWAPLFAAARLGAPEAFAAVPSQWWPEHAPDVREAREGMYAGHRVGVEAATRDGRPIYFRLRMPWTTTPQSAAAAPSRAVPPQFQAALVAFWVGLVALAVLARRNLRLGRSDRAAARKLAVALVVAWTVTKALSAETGAALVDFVNGPTLLAQPLLFGLFAWVGYTGFEPQLRRAWPHLLITSTRLLSGRWRDPLVGCAVLAGVLVGLVFALPASVAIPRWLDLPGGGPTAFVAGTLNRGRFFLAMQLSLLGLSLLLTLLCLTVLLLVRQVVRRTDLAWAVFTLLMIGFGFLSVRGMRPTTTSSLLLLAVAGVFWLALVWLLWKHGALALAVALLVSNLVQSAPWTLDMSRWYWWRGLLIAAIVAALALWGFRNALGRQSAFPAGALD